MLCNDFPHQTAVNQTYAYFETAWVPESSITIRREVVDLFESVLSSWERLQSVCDHNARRVESIAQKL
jgi:hypothetical protein